MGPRPTSAPGPRRLRSGIAVAAGLATLLLGSGCGSDGDGNPPPLRPAITPICTVLCDAFHRGFIDKDGRVSPAWNGDLFTADRTDPNGSNFTPLRAMAGPIGNGSIGTPGTARPRNDAYSPSSVDAYAASEAWQRFAGSPLVWRGLATPANRDTASGSDTLGSSWQIHAQDETGRWSGVLGRGTANSGRDADDPDTAALAVPQLMTVGVAEPQVFACAGERTQNDAGRTTWLIEAVAPNVGRGNIHVERIQDLLYGDDRWAMPPSEPLSPAPTGPPTPTVRGPGDPSGGLGAVQCAMTQVEDDPATRELHMISVANGHLSHAMASDWGTANFDNGTSINRFRAISRWSDVSQELGVNFGPITSAAIVARPSAISVFFLAAAGGRYRLWHTVRFPDGSWRPAKDVLALSGDAPSGIVHEFEGVAAGNCPAYGADVWDASSNETLVALWSGDPGNNSPNQVLVIRVVQTPQQWQTGTTGVYAPWQHVPMGPLQNGNVFEIRNVAITARPFRDDLAPVP